MGTISVVNSFSRPTLTLVTGRKLYRPRPDKKEEPLSVVDAAIIGGVDIVQLRTRTTSSDDDLGLFAVAMRLRELTAGRAQFVITGDIVLAEKCGADGVLLFDRTYKPTDARAFLRSEGAKSVGVFCRTVMAASKAERGGADYVQVGPAFEPDADASEVTDGLTLLRKIKDAVQIPVLAFGGIQTPERIVDCLRAGADGVAVTEAIADAPDPEQATKALRIAMDAAWRVLHDA